MKTRIPGMPGPLAHCLCVVLCLGLTVLLTLMGVAFPTVRLLTDQGLHLSIAQADAVIDAQYTRIGEAVDALAQKYPFEPKTVMDFVTRDRLEDFNAQVVHWWMGLLQADPVLTAPSYDVEGLLDAVKADETFRAGVPESSWTATARDKIVQGVQDIVVQAVTPLRLSLLSLGLGKALSMADVPTLRGYLPYLPWALLAACVLLAGLLLLCTHRRMIKGVLYIGSACGAAGICLGVIMGAVAYLDLPGRLAAASALLSMQLRLLLQSLALPMGLTALGLLVLGLMLIGIHQHRMNRLRLSVMEGSSYGA